MKMKITRATIKKCIKDLGLNLENFNISGNEIETARDNVAAGNVEVKRVVKVLAAKGAAYNGFKTGYGSWIFRFEAKTELSKLVSMNID
jgi:hypothetical protein